MTSLPCIFYLYGRQNLAPSLASYEGLVNHAEAARFPDLVEDLIPVRGKLKGFGTASTNLLLTILIILIYLEKITYI